MSDAWLRSELERIHTRLRSEDRKRRAAKREADTRAKVAAYLAEHPEATANAVCAAIGGKRALVLQAVREARRPVPTPGYQPSETGRQ